MPQSIETESYASEARIPARCWFCGSRDTMAPLTRPERITLISALLPLRWRYCRKCTRHFIATGKPRRRH